MANLQFNASQVPPDEGFNPVPAGQYLCQVISSEIKPTKSGTGTILKLTSQILDGPYNGRLIFDNLNVSNPNPDAERISQRSLADLILAVGMTVLADTEELHFKPFIGKVGIRQDKSGAYPPQNTIRYTPRAGNEPPPRQAEENKPVQPQIQQPPKPNGKPWQKPQARY
jgi:hypothetical protein